MSVATPLVVRLACALLTLASLPMAASAQLTRSQAAAILLDPANGVAIDTQASSVWSPFFDFGFGPGFEGLLPTGSSADPAESGWPPYPGPGRTLTTDAYLFWIDDEPSARMQHGTRFAFVDAQQPTPNVANGGIVVDNQGWWPVLTWSGGGPTAWFENDIDRTSASPSGASNPDGAIAGPVASPASLVMPPPPPPSSAASAAPSNACALLMRGSGAEAVGLPDSFRADLWRWETDLKTLYGVEDSRIVRAAGGQPASWDEFCDAVDMIKVADPPCDKIYVRMTSHGNTGSLTFKGVSKSAAAICNKLKDLASLDVPICLIIDACRSESLLDVHNWNFPKDSSILVSAAADKSCTGGVFEQPGGFTFLGGLFSYSLSQCARDITDSDGDGIKDADYTGDGVIEDFEAYRWMLAKQPCYTLHITGSPFWAPNSYPAGDPSGTPGDADDPEPNLRLVATDPRSISTLAKNKTQTPKTDFHMVFAGDVRGGKAEAYRSNGLGFLLSPWADGLLQSFITFDPNTNETTVSWDDSADPVLFNQFAHFNYTVKKGGLKLLRQWGTPTTVPVADIDKFPKLEGRSSLEDDGATVQVNLVSRSTAAGGWGQLLSALVTLRASPYEIPQQNLSLSDPLLFSLPSITMGPIPVTPDTPVELDFPVPGPFEVYEHLVLQLDLSWALNGNETTELVLLEPLGDWPWSTVGTALGGTPTLAEAPSLLGAGPLISGSSNGVKTVNALPFSSGFLLLSLNALNAPFKGGLLVPAPDILIAHPLDGLGGFTLPFSWPPGVPAGIPFYLQDWIVDPGGPSGFAATAGLQGTSS